MHELSIAQSLIELASDAAAREGASRVRKLHLRIGNLSGVGKDALLFSFELAAERSVCEGAELDIETVPIVVRCPQCDEAKTLSTYCFKCATCGTPTAEILMGRELELVSIEVDSHETACA